MKLEEDQEGYSKEKDKLLEEKNREKEQLLDKHRKEKDDILEEHRKEKELLEQNFLHQTKSMEVDQEALREQIEKEVAQDIQTQLEVSE